MHFVTSLAQQGCLQFFVALSAWNTRAPRKILLRGPREVAWVLQRRLLSTRAGRELRIIWGRAQSQTLPDWREWVWRVRNWPCREAAGLPLLEGGPGAPSASPEPEGALRALGSQSVGAQRAHHPETRELVRNAESQGPPQLLKPRLRGWGPEG